MRLYLSAFYQNLYKPQEISDGTSCGSAKTPAHIINTLSIFTRVRTVQVGPQTLIV